MSNLIDEYKAMLMNADSLDIVYLSAESTDLYPEDGAELVSLTGVNSLGDVVLNMRFDVRSDYTGEEYHGIKKEDIAGLPFAGDVLAELKHFLANDNGNKRWCWAGWFISFFSQLLGEKPAVNSVKELVCGTDLAYEIDFDEYSTLRSTAFVLRIPTASVSKEKLGFLLMQKLVKLVPMAEEMAKLKNRLWALEKEFKNEFEIIIDPPKPYNQPVNFNFPPAPAPKSETMAGSVTDDDIPF